MIAIVDYGLGNLRSVQKALEKVGHAATITSDAAELSRAERVILPGVGASADALAAVRAQGLEGPLKDFIASGRPFLGVCLGLQMLYDWSYEDGEHRGLGILPGKVVRFDVPAGLKVPHMGWNQVRFAHRPPIFAGIDDGAYFYFVHSYHVVNDDPACVATETDYGGPFCSSVWRDNLYATQFHPEKSQAAGLRLLKNFAELPISAGG
ncbi:Imidazole glycerol phosphate synthase subunit HisH 1 [Botrimarina colliarenosi]|uniref:Imidazole glycerol phosphate synthase subunit HisH n=1 Tax=Botrimarina colliarenosi TaxID=2528001 RepID=A0A5C6AK46_9BACT|nr:imidazole glycerol phosphate synthase subunit HisH [Botrimarina colliarenosi]TWT99618.1 Imidazole glycerol phosphate synthase subunit HisH 1 [Botrimarina colliarenosi]